MSITLNRPYSATLSFVSMEERKHVVFNIEFKAHGIFISASVNNQIVSEKYEEYTGHLVETLQLMIQGCQVMIDKGIEKETEVNNG